MKYSKDPREEIFELLSGIEIRIHRRMNIILKNHNLTYAQFGALAVIYNLERFSKETNQKSLADLLKTDTTNIMVICDGLERKGFIERKHPEGNRRTNILILTKKGREVYLSSLPEVENYFKPLAELITDPEREVLSAFLARIYKKTEELSELEV